MSGELDRYVALGRRAREALATGSTLDEVLRSFRDDEQLGSIGAIVALREIAPIGLPCAKVIVGNWCEGQSYAHVTLADLDLIADAPRVAGPDYFLQRHRDDAIIERKPYLSYMRDRTSTRSVRHYASAVPVDPATLGDRQTGSQSGDSVTFERVIDDVRRAVAAWPTELCIERDEPDLLLLRFLRVRAVPNAE